MLEDRISNDFQSTIVLIVIDMQAHAWVNNSTHASLSLEWQWRLPKMQVPLFALVTQIERERQKHIQQ